MTELNEALFSGVRLKIKRAGEHIQDFEGHILRFVRDHGHSVRVHHKTNTGRDALEFLPCQAIPQDLMSIAGDAIHNLRSALDFAMSDIEFATTGKRTEDVTFPARKTRDQVEAAIRRRLEHKAPKRVLDYIVQSIQPYEGGKGDPIWQLHRLDIVDKHRLIVPHLQFEWVRNIRYVDETGETFTVPEWAVTQARSLMIPTEKRGVQVTYKGNATVGILFGHGMPLERRLIFPTLNNLAVFVSRTLLVLEREFSKSRNK